jgi:hypothetical protein
MLSCSALNALLPKTHINFIRKWFLLASIFLHDLLAVKLLLRDQIIPFYQFREGLQQVTSINGN